MDIKKEARKFRRKLKGKVNLKQIQGYVSSSLGYEVVLFKPNSPNEQIDLYNLQEDALTKKAFTYTGLARIIFINQGLTKQDRLHLLLHEVGHIILGHVGKGKIIEECDQIETDTQASLFAWEVSHPTCCDRLLYLSLGIFLGLLFSVILTYVPPDSPHENTPAPAGVSLPISFEGRPADTGEPSLSNDIVYVTKTGNKYHRSICGYAKNAIAMERDEAQENYEPCKVCNP